MIKMKKESRQRLSFFTIINGKDCFEISFSGKLAKEKFALSAISGMVPMDSNMTDTQNHNRYAEEWIVISNSQQEKSHDRQSRTRNRNLEKRGVEIPQRLRTSKITDPEAFISSVSSPGTKENTAVPES